MERARLSSTHEAWLPSDHELYRPRHGRRQHGALVSALVFFLAPTLAFVFGTRPTAFDGDKTHDFPSLTSGWTFFTELPEWAIDNLPLQQAGVIAANTISRWFGDPPGSVGSAESGPVGIGSSRTEEEAAHNSNTLKIPEVLIGKHGWYYFGQAISNKCNPVMDIASIINRLRRLRDAVQSSGRQFILVIAPDKSTMVPEYLPENFPGEVCFRKRSKKFWNRVPEALNAVEMRSALRMTVERLDRRLYDPHGTHWSFAAGLAMTRLVAERISPGISTSWQTAPAGIQKWQADLARMLGVSEYRTLRRYALAPSGDKDRTRYIASNFKRPLHLSQTGDSSNSGVIEQSVAVVADSFTQFATPFFAAAYEDVTIVHRQTVATATPTELAQLFADRDVIVFEFVERNLSGGSSRLLRDRVIDKISRVLERNPR